MVDRKTAASTAAGPAASGTGKVKFGKPSKLLQIFG
jgi:hypothetical protein